VIKSYWIPETKHSRGRWAGVNAPIAWQPFVVPDHPGAGKEFESGANAATDSPALAKSNHEEAAQGAENDI
jgi:hypothetical protein